MTEIQKLKNQVNILTILLSSTILFTILVNAKSFAEEENIIRTQGIVIEDQEGREGILIGAPIPLSSYRVRDDYDKVEKAYSDWFPPEANFMSNFKSQVAKKTNGMLILDENGFDQLAFGDPVPDPFMGRRIGPSTGMVINDSVGVERSGYGLLKFPDRYRVTLGFDRSDGLEGMIFGLDDNGHIELTLRSDNLNEVITMGNNTQLQDFDIHFINRSDSTIKKTMFQ